MAATTRRRPAAAGPIPGPSLPPATRWGDARAGHLPANRRPAVPTRVHQSGGPPTHAAPARRADPRARPPPASGPRVDYLQASRSWCSSGCPHLDSRSHIRMVPLCVKDQSGSSEVLGVTRSSGGAGAADAGQVPGRRPWHTSGGVPASREDVRACARSFPRPQRPADRAAWGGASTRESYHDRASPQHQL